MIVVCITCGGEPLDCICADAVTDSACGDCDAEGCEECRSYTCSECGERVSWAYRDPADAPETCDACWAKRAIGERLAAASSSHIADVMVTAASIAGRPTPESIAQARAALSEDPS